jgi:hypothetical protein
MPPQDEKMKLFIKQDVWEVDPLDRWLDVSTRITRSLGMPARAPFKLKPLDGDYDLQTPQGGLEVYAFERKSGMQYWPTCEYDGFADQHRQERKQIVIIDE